MDNGTDTGTDSLGHGLGDTDGQRNRKGTRTEKQGKEKRNIDREGDRRG